MSRARARSARRKQKKPRREDVELVKMALLARRSGVPTPTIKHYIREGLVPGPVVRTSKNMAYYDARNVERLRAIKELQAKQFLPLRVIAELLEPAPSAKLRADASSQRRALTALVPAVTTDRKVQRRRRADVQKTDLTKGELDQLERAGVIELQGSGDTAGYSGFDLDIVELIAEIYRLGYRGVFPISVAAKYLAEVKKLVAFEIDVFRQHALSAPLPAPLPDVARQGMQFGERLTLALRSKILPALLAQVGT
jgi:DNA-binding transcriptional MerR regulator